MEQVILSGNCYWTLEAAFQRIKGINKVVSGKYSLAPYEFKFSDDDKVEAVLIEFDESKISLDKILDIFYKLHNPNINSWDMEKCFAYHYRSSIIIKKEQKEIAENKVKEVTESQEFGDSTDFGGSINTKVIIVMDDLFTAAGARDKGYYNSNPKDPYCTSMIKPKLEKIAAVFPSIFKE